MDGLPVSLMEWRRAAGREELNRFEQDELKRRWGKCYPDSTICVLFFTRTGVGCN